MWIAIIVVAYLVLSVVAVFIFFCAVALAGSVAENPQQGREPSVVERSAQFPALSSEIEASASKSRSLGAAAQSQQTEALAEFIGEQSARIDSN